MPIYEYACTSCDHRTDILHGLNDPGPTFCPSCGREGTMRKRFAPPTIHFRGSGWAKKDRGTSNAAKAASGSKPDSAESGAAKSDDGTPRSDKDTSSTSDKGGSSAADSGTSSSSGTSSGPQASGD